MSEAMTALAEKPEIKLVECDLPCEKTFQNCHKFYFKNKDLSDQEAFSQCKIRLQSKKGSFGKINSECYQQHQCLLTKVMKDLEGDVECDRNCEKSFEYCHEELSKDKQILEAFEQCKEMIETQSSSIGSKGGYCHGQAKCIFTSSMNMKALGGDGTIPELGKFDVPCEQNFTACFNFFSKNKKQTDRKAFHTCQNKLKEQKDDFGQEGNICFNQGDCLFTEAMYALAGDKTEFVQPVECNRNCEIMFRFCHRFYVLNKGKSTQYAYNVCKAALQNQEEGFGKFGGRCHGQQNCSFTQAMETKNT